MKGKENKIEEKRKGKEKDRKLIKVKYKKRKNNRIMKK